MPAAGRRKTEYREKVFSPEEKDEIDLTDEVLAEEMLPEIIGEPVGRHVKDGTPRYENTMEYAILKKEWRKDYMVRWVKLFGNQYLGFWVLGLVLFALQELPYMLMPLFHLETNPIMNMTETSVILDICEKLLGSLCIALMVFIVHRDAKLSSVSDGREKLFFTLAIIMLLANFTGWALYFTGHQSVFVMMLFIVALPPLYYVAIGIWRQNTPLSICGALFLAVHFMHVLGNLRG